MGYQPSVADIILAFFRLRTPFTLVCGDVFLAGGGFAPPDKAGASLVSTWQSGHRRT
jgi:hypothetical protein